MKAAVNFLVALLLCGCTLNLVYVSGKDNSVAAGIDKQTDVDTQADLDNSVSERQ